jgi:RNase H-like domain found in reverse transcriptase
MQLLPDAHFAVITALLFKLTRKNTGYKGGPLPPAAMDAFINLRKQLILEPVMAFPWTDWQYVLITDANTSTADTPGGLGAILTQVDQDRKFYAISFTSQQLKDHEKNYSPFLLEAAAAVWEWIISKSTSKARSSSCTWTTSR